ncbi:MAG TPA: hypothetical protein VGA28_00425 [Desulfurivibrionaceae bacterium]|jgi:hypothetical protein
MAIIRFSILGNVVQFGAGQRQKITDSGCNEPYKDRYWCPRKKWFNTEPCPFACLRECENYQAMCGSV